MGGIFVGLLHLASMFNVFRVLYLCTWTDPGIIPKVSSEGLEDLSAHYLVKYRKPSEITYEPGQSAGAKFFSTKMFQVMTAADEN